MSPQQGKKSVISSTVLLPIFLVMTHSSTLYEKEVGAGLVVNSEEKKETVRPILLPKASHIKHQIEKKNKTKQLVPWKSTAGKGSE